MSTNIELASERLFGREGLKVNNIHISMNETSTASAEQIAEQINKVLDQLESGDFELIKNFDD